MSSKTKAIDPTLIYGDLGDKKPKTPGKLVTYIDDGTWMWTEGVKEKGAQCITGCPHAVLTYIESQTLISFQKESFKQSLNCKECLFPGPRLQDGSTGEEVEFVKCYCFVFACVYWSCNALIYT